MEVKEKNNSKSMNTDHRAQEGWGSQELRGLCPGDWASPRMETPWPPWAAQSHVRSCCRASSVGMLGSGSVSTPPAEVSGAGAGGSSYRKHGGLDLVFW